MQTLSNEAPRKGRRAKPSAIGQFDTLPDSAFVRLPTVADLIDSSGATVWRWVKAGRLPAPKKLGPQSVAWNVGELRRAMAAQMIAG